MSAPSQSHDELIRYAKKHAFTVTWRQIERWRQAGLIEEGPRKGLGQGRGRAPQQVTPEMKMQLIWVCVVLEQTGRLPT